MNFDLSEEQNLLIQTTRSFVKNELMQYEELLEKTNNLPKELYEEIKKKSREVGLYSCNMPKEHGGGGLNVFDLTIVEKELGHTSLALAEIAWRPQNILMACKGDLIEEYLKPATTGERKDCIAMTEPEAGSDLRGMKTNAVKKEVIGLLMEQSTLFLMPIYLILLFFSLLQERMNKEGIYYHAFW